MDENESWVLVLKALNCRQATMGGAVVDDPEDTARVIVGRPGHNLMDEPIKRSNSTTRFAATKDFGPVNIEGGQVGPCSASFVFVFNFHRRFWLRWQSRVKPASGLNAGFLVGGDDKFVVQKRLSAPNTFIKIQDPSGLQSEIRIAREDPCAVLPRSDRVSMQPSPNGAVADTGNQPRLAHFVSQFTNTPTGERNVMYGGQFTGERLNLNDQFWGEKPGDAPADRAPRVLRAVLQRTVFATCSPLLVAYPDAKQFGHWRVPRPPSRSSWRAAPENTVTYIVRRGGATLGLRTWIR